MVKTLTSKTETLLRRRRDGTETCMLETDTRDWKICKVGQSQISRITFLTWIKFLTFLPLVLGFSFCKSSADREQVVSLSCIDCR